MTTEVVQLEVFKESSPKKVAPIVLGVPYEDPFVVDESTVPEVVEYSLVHQSFQSKLTPEKWVLRQNMDKFIGP